MKAAIYNPYLDTLGGGERYSIAFGSALVEVGYKVDIYWKHRNIKEKIEKRFGIDMQHFEIVNDIKKGDGYDVCFWLSVGSIPLLRARKNFLHFQFPFRDVNGSSLINKMKLFRIEKVICNSYFTKKFVDDEFKVKSVVIYPPVDTDTIKPKRKENIILFVGRFSQLTQVKNQHILIEIFKKLSKSEGISWKLVLAGGTEIGADEYLKLIEKSSLHKNIEIIKSPSFSDLKDLYGKAKIFWSAVGYGVNSEREPQKAEHFGISVVEAMSAGVVPLVYDAGGYKEIVSDGINGFLWKDKREFVKKAKSLINNPKLLLNISKQAKKEAQVYEYNRFFAEVQDLLT